MTKYDKDRAFRSKRFTMDGNDESSFCGLDQNEKRQKMNEESQRLKPTEYEENNRYVDSEFKARYTREKRSTMDYDQRERTCCYIYIRVDPTLWEVVYKNEGLNVSYVC